MMDSLVLAVIILVFFFAGYYFGLENREKPHSLIDRVTKKISKKKAGVVNILDAEEENRREQEKNRSFIEKFLGGE